MVVVRVRYYDNIIGRFKGARGTHASPIYFNFMQFLRSNGQNNRLAQPHIGVGAPVWEILDPPLDVVPIYPILCVDYCSNLHKFNCSHPIFGHYSCNTFFDSLLQKSLKQNFAILHRIPHSILHMMKVLL